MPKEHTPDDQPTASMQTGRARDDAPSMESIRAASAERVGDSIGPYKLLEVLGEGGFGLVWLAERREPMVQRAALKIIKPGMDSRAVVARFEQERQALAVMDHPNVAKVLDGGVTPNGRPYFVMELVKGEPITAFADRHRLTIRQRLELFLPVCEAVQHAHIKGIIHRDLKPTNILVAPGGEGQPPIPKVIDFGVAKAIHSTLTNKTIFTEQGQLIGTPEYMSPEQAEMGALDIDTRTDVYSLGVVLYELLSGTLPFDSKTLRSAGYAEIQRIIREVDAPRPSTRLSTADDSTGATIARARQADRERIAGELRRELEWIPLKALRKDRARRYASAESLGADVRRYLEGKPLEAAPESRTYQLRKFVRRNRGQVSAAGAVILALIAGLATTLWQAREAARQRDVAVLAVQREAEQRGEAERRRAEADEQRARADERALAAEIAERAEKERADQLRKVSDFQSEMLSQIDTNVAGKGLMADVLARFTAALETDGVPPAERSAQVESLGSLLARVNATDAAAALIDRTILKPAIKAVDEQFKEDPATDARLRQTLADLYRLIGLYDAATPLQDAALATRRSLLGDDHPNTLTSIDNKGALLLYQGKFVEAERYMREALDGRRRLQGEDHKDTLGAKNNLGTLLVTIGKRDDGLRYLSEALESARRVLGNDHPDTVLMLVNLMGQLSSQRDPREAEPLLREAVERSRRVLGPENRDTLAAINNLAGFLQDQGKLAEAETLLREALENCRRTLGEEHQTTISLIGNLGHLLQGHGDPAEAEKLLRESADKSRRVNGTEHPITVGAINNLGMVLVSRGNMADAEALLRESYDAARRALGNDHPLTIGVPKNLGALLTSQGRLSEAEMLFREALERCRRGTGEGRLGTVSAINGLVKLFQSQGRHAEAEPLLREAIGLARQMSGDRRVEAIVEINNLGFFFREGAGPAEAEELLRMTLAMRRRVQGDEHPSSQEALLNLADTLERNGKFAEAEPLYAESVLFRTKTMAPNDWRIFNMKSRLGGSLLRQNKFAQAEPILLEAFQGLAASPATRRKPEDRLAEGAQRIVDLYTAWNAAEPGKGYDAKAAEWRAKMPPPAPANTEAGGGPVAK